MTRFFLGVDGGQSSTTAVIGDESGRVVARVYPAADPSEYEPWVPPISDEELRRLEHSDEKRYTTAEVLAHLDRL